MRDIREEMLVGGDLGDYASNAPCSICASLNGNAKIKGTSLDSGKGQALLNHIAAPLNPSAEKDGQVLTKFDGSPSPIAKLHV